MSITREKLAQSLKAEALRLGFSACGISKADFLEDEARKLEAWLTGGHQAGMAWMEGHFDKRTDPRKLVVGAKSVISVIHTYYQPIERPNQPTAGKISRYAWGDDYHDVLKDKLRMLFHWLEDHVGTLHGRAFVDSAPVMDKVWAAKSGLGWIGKNTNLISRTSGSFFFIGELIVDLDLPPDSPIPDYCGSCTRCIDACPTDAIHPTGFVQAEKCISYWTIEHKGTEAPVSLTRQFDQWIFGCDVCQEVCPWNKFKKPTKEPRFEARSGMADTPLQTWMELDLEEFRKRFKGNPIKRTKYEGFKRNIRWVLPDNPSS
ncbi:MAG TPA: tRNA epoxyqueuosine(34) reductase QueG [Rhodothermales bacterium]|nr:tRNA epoxyqueuosine(34) reductase QueG [Rhodothermales bacterium]HRR09327.1 tRNA epoxyqueuosine(34) reductase QueG [Rhodothermales bacterium]